MFDRPEVKPPFRAAPRPFGWAFLLWALVGQPALAAAAALKPTAVASAWELLLAAVVAGLPLAFFGRLLLASVDFDETELRVDNPFRSTRIPWSEVKAVSSEELTVETASARIPLTALRLRRPGRLALALGRPNEPFPVVAAAQIAEAAERSLR